MIDGGGSGALDALGFRIRGSGARVAEAFGPGGAMLGLVINYARGGSA